MKQVSIMDSEKGCTCSDWSANVMLLRDLALLDQTNEKRSSLTSFRFCPWCGHSLSGATGNRDKTLLEQAKHRIQEDFFSSDEWGVPQTPNMLVAARPCADYRQATGDILGTLDLMLTFVETGTQFTNQFGDMDEPFYEGLELMLDDFRELLLEHPELYGESKIAQRLSQLLKDAGWLGWGYGDAVKRQVGKIQKYFGDI